MNIKLPDIYIQMILSLLILAAIAAMQYGITSSVLQILYAVIPAVLLDLILKRYTLRKFILPKSAIITGLLVALVISPGTQWYVLVMASVMAIASKHLLKVGSRNIFNPAAFGLLAVFMAFRVGDGWWASSSIIAVLVLGLLIAYRIKRLTVAVVFIAVFEALFTLLNFHLVAAHPLALLNPTVMFFAFLMLIEHKTSPLTLKSGIAYSVIVGVLSVAFFTINSSADFLLLALVIGNLFVAFNNRLRLIR
ncbi:MAG TPA: RnfABCDGE type electron transport complex subunit D [Candidatus Baltobacteraceae bacterium]|nr:RnfABCDGE type electron transport complex subunit D [Candidatus Baltobacteraceae bacterium]